MSKYTTIFAVAGLALAGLFVWQVQNFRNGGAPILTSTPPPLTENSGTSPTPAVSRAPSPASSPRTTPLATPSAPLTSGVIHTDVAFTSQAPLGEWSDPRQQDGCEEASSLMAMYWVRGIPSITPEKAKQEILAIVAWEESNYSNSRDTSAQDTADRIIKGHYKHSNVRVETGINVNDIIDAVKAGNMVIVPADGQLLGNPNFTPPGPERHKLLIIGYDPAAKQFITNDPGTRRGKNYRYGQTTLFNAISDYPTSVNNQPVSSSGMKKSMIVIGK